MQFKTEIAQYNSASIFYFMQYLYARLNVERFLAVFVDN